MKRLVESPIWVCPVCVQLSDPGSVRARGRSQGWRRWGERARGRARDPQPLVLLPQIDPDGLFLATVHSPSAGVWLQSLSLGGINA